MSSSIALRHVRHLSTAAATAAAAKPVTISNTKSKLKSVQDPDEALKIYTAYTAANNPSSSPSSTRHAQAFTVRRLAKSHRFSEIETFLESHKSRPQITDEPYLSSIIRSYGIAGMVENALNTYNQMTDLGTPRSSLSFNSLLSACIESKVFDRVPTLFYEFPTKFGFSPDKSSYGILIKSYCEIGSPEIAIEKLNEMEEKGFEINAVVFTTILHSLYKNGKVDEAEKFWDEIVNEKGCKPDAVAYNVRLSQLQGGDPAPLKALIEEMSSLGIRPDTSSYNLLMNCYYKNGMLDEAEKVVDEVLMGKEYNPNAGTFRTSIFYMCKNEMYVSGYKMFKKSVKVRKIPDFNTLKYLVQGLVKNGHKNEAIDVYRTVTKKFPANLVNPWVKLAEELGLEVLDSSENEAGKVIDVKESENVST